VSAAINCLPFPIHSSIMQLQLGISSLANPTELLGLRFVDQKRKKLTSNKASIRRVARHSGVVIQDTSLKTGQWRSRAQPHVSCTLKSLKLARARYVIKHRLKRINALLQSRQERSSAGTLFYARGFWSHHTLHKRRKCFARSPPPLFPK